MSDLKIMDYASDKRGYIRVIDGDVTVCDIFPFAEVGGVGIERARENARKIVNADRTLDALQGLIEWCEEGCPEGGRYALEEAWAAFKATHIKR